MGALEYLQWAVDHVVGIFCLCLCAGVLIASVGKGILYIIRGIPEREDNAE